MIETSKTKVLNEKCQNWKIFTATTLKLIAVALMFMDHIHQMFVSVGAPMWLTMVGRLVFPIFLFVSAESFHYTRSKKEYLKRLLFASWGMTVLTFLLQQIVPNENVVLMNNAFSTFFVAGLYMLFWDWILEGIREKKPKKLVKGILCCFIPILTALPMFLVGMLSANENISILTLRTLATLSLLLPNILTVEGGVALVVLGLVFYIFREYRIIQMVALLALSALVFSTGGRIQALMGLSVFPIALYNGKRGRDIKLFFYIFYPLHIVILYLISSWML
ncbi:MAG: TraX family protein [Filifactoraceae bacterium]